MVLAILLPNFLKFAFTSISFFSFFLVFSVGFWPVAGETEIKEKIRDMEKVEERLTLFTVDVLDYHTILLALKGCSALFCCLDSPDAYDVGQVGS